MSGYFFPMAAAFSCALCNGTAAVLQKISADKEKKVNSLDASLMWRLIQDKPYVGGVLLDIFGWLLTLYAVQYLPLFLVEALIAANIVVTAVIERLFKQQQIKTRSYFAIGLIVAGLVTLAIASSPGRAEPIGRALLTVIVLLPLPVAAAGFILARSKKHLPSVGLAVFGGLSFGDTSVLGRVFKFSHPLWHTIYSPSVFAIAASGALGMLLFSIALQRAQATVMNATMTASQTLIPAIIGIAFLGDAARNGMWYLVAIGTLLTLGGVGYLALNSTN